MATNLLPDFAAIGKTNWGKPAFDDKNALIGMGIALVAFILVFFGWWTISIEGWGQKVSESQAGIKEWMGILYLICSLPMLFGWLYRHIGLAFCASCGCILFSFLGVIIVPGASAEDIQMAKAFGASISHLGAILALIASIGSAAWAFVCANKK